MTEAPKIDLNLNVNVKKLQGDFYEVMLDINSTAKVKDQDLFIIELKYAGIFELINVPEDQKESL
jgi:preprotein translocase subunit SecB